jgi:hypothetical protein
MTAPPPSGTSSVPPGIEVGGKPVGIVQVWLLASPTLLRTRTRNRSPLSSMPAEAIRNDGEVAPAMSEPLRCHW